MIHDVPERPMFINNQSWSGGTIPTIAYINESASVNTVIGNQLLFTDPDINDSHTFTLSCIDSLASCPFDINQQGTVYLKDLQNFDYEVRDQWAIRVRVTDSSMLFDEIMLSIHLLDVNEPPHFSQNILYRVGSYPPQLYDLIGIPVTAVDPENNIESYSLSNSTLFSIDSIGQIRLISLAVNPWMSYNVTVTATDSEGLSDSVLVIISFNTDDSKSFEVRNQSYVVAEDHPIRMEVAPALTVLGTFASPLRYELSSSASPFMIDSESGMLYHSFPLDYESANFYAFQVMVTDYYGNQATGNITVSVTDVNEPPTLSQSSCLVRRSILEESEDNTFIYPEFSATDPDFNDTLTYSARPIHSFDDLPFSIHPTLGLLYVTNSSLLKYQYHSYYDFFVTVTDSGGLNDSCLIHIDVTKRNHPPVLHWIQNDIYVREDIPQGSFIPIPIFATDDDQLSYSVTDVTNLPVESYSFPFSFVTDDIGLSVDELLDYESISEYVLLLCVSDSVAQKSCDNVTIHVIDVNEPPTFESDVYSLSLPENTPVGTLIFNVTTSDPENHTIYYSVESSVISIDKWSGQVSLNMKLDFEERESFNISVLAFDEYGLSASTLLNINVIDVNEPPICLDSMWSVVNVMENEPVGTVVATINVTDTEVQHGRQSLSYSLIDDISQFTVNEYGEVIINEPLNYWNQSHFTLHVHVEDNGIPILSTQCSITINVIDVNDPPTLHGPSIIHVAEDTPLYKPIETGLWASDPDVGQQLFFDMELNEVFGIDPLTGNLFLKQHLDYETRNMYTVQITVHDISQNPLSDSKMLTVLVDDVNEPPQWYETAFFVSENTPVGSIIGFISYHDPDQGVNGTVHCYQQSHLDIFKTHNTTCRVSLLSELDYEQEKEYNLLIHLVDGGGLVVSNIIRIVVLDVNEPPVISVPSTTLSIVSDTPINTTLAYPITVSDPENDDILLFISNSANPLPVSLIQVTGNQYGLMVNDTLTNSFSFQLNALDKHDLSSSVLISIEVVPATPINPVYHPVSCSVVEGSEFPATLENCTLSIENYEMFTNVTFIKEFSIASSDFAIQPLTPKTASVQVIGEVDFEVMNHYVIPIVIEGVNLQGKLLSIHSFFIVDVIDVNEAPVFDSEPSVVYVYENSVEDSVLYPCLRAVDPDESDRNESIVYSMSEENDTNEWIGIQAYTGCLIVKQNGLDYENSTQPKSFDLQIVATDSHGAFSTRFIHVEVLNVNEPPVFSSSSYYFTLSAPVPLNTEIGYPLPVIDEDLNSLSTFSIEQQSCPNGFRIDSASGQLITGSSQIPQFGISLDQNVTCIIHVRVEDEGGLSDYTIVYVTIMSDVRPPVIYSDSFTVQENPTENTIIGTLAAASMCDSMLPGGIEFMILPSQYSHIVSVDEDLLLVKEPDYFDYESLMSFSIHVMAVDKACFNISSIQEIVIFISDVNEPPMVINALYHVYPGASYPLSLSPSVIAADPEGTALHFSILSSNPNITINDAGFIQLLGDLTASIPNDPDIAPSITTHRFVFTGVVSDSSDEGLSTRFNITLDIDKLHLGNQASLPSYSLSFKEEGESIRSISEATPVGSVVGEPFEVETADENPTLFYHIPMCSPYCPVFIHSVLGYLVLNTTLDFESVPSYQLNVTVTNGVVLEWILVTLIVEDANDCVISSITPSSLTFSSNHLTMRGQNLSPKGQSLGFAGQLITGDSYTTDFDAVYTVFDTMGGFLQSGSLSNCSVLGMDWVDCVMPATMGSYVSIQVTWKSSIPSSIQHSCSMSTSILHYEGLHLTDVKNSNGMSTTGAVVCFAGENMGTSELFSPYLGSSYLSASATLVDSTELIMASCEYNSEEEICCLLDNGYGSTILWKMCLFGYCSTLEKGSFAAPIISNVSASASLNCLGGDEITIYGSNFGANSTALTVLMGSNSIQSKLTQCEFVVLHSVIRCRSVEGSGESLVFSVTVGDQSSSSFVSSLAYSPPVIQNVYGIGSANALTSGGQVVYVAGLNLGAYDGVSRLLYGNSTDLPFETAPCDTVLPHTLLRCITSPGSGYQDRWVVEVESHRSQPFIQQTGIYGYPAVTDVDKLHIGMPPEGGLEILITGANFGSDDALLHVWYVNEFGQSYLPECWIHQNHTQLKCLTTAGIGKNIQWSIEVNGLLSENAFTMAYVTPTISSVECKTTGCGRVSGNETVVLRGTNFANATIEATYGFTGSEFVAQQCQVVSNTMIECLTAAGVGQDLTWKVWIGGQEAIVSPTAVFSYHETDIRYLEGKSIALKGGDLVFIHVSNDFVGCSECSFKMIFNGVSVDAAIQNSTTLEAISPPIQYIVINVQLIVYYRQYLVETTNIISLPIQDPTIESTMIQSTSNLDTYQLSLIGENFGFLESVVSVHITSSEGETSSCTLDRVSNDFVSCRTHCSDGSVYLERNAVKSNIVEFATNSVMFDLSGFSTDIEGYLVYPQLFNTTGGEQLVIRGEDFPSSLQVTIGKSHCQRSSLNSTFLSCIVPPGEGKLLPVRIISNQKVLLQIFMSYYEPYISTISPSSLQFDTQMLEIEGVNFGLNPLVLVSGFSFGTLNCSVTSHTHTWIQCSLEAIDALGLALQINVADQTSNTVILTIVSPKIELIGISDLNGMELQGIPTDGEGILTIHGVNLDADVTLCRMNGQTLEIVSKNSTMVQCRLIPSFDAVAAIQILADSLHSNIVSIPYLSPVISTITPSQGSTNGGEAITIHGSNFGCSDANKDFIQIHFGSSLIPIKTLSHCSHGSIEFMSPEGQGTDISVYVSRYNYSSLHSHFNYSAPIIHVLQASVFNQNQLALKMQSSLMFEQPVFILDGANFGSHSAEVFVSDKDCVVIQQSHSQIVCISPFFLGGTHNVHVVVAGQSSNSVNYTFPSPQVTSIHPLIVESAESTLYLDVSHLPPVSGLQIQLRIGTIAVDQCHVSLASTDAMHYIECHLPELRRGEWKMSLAIAYEEISIPETFDTLTVVCRDNQYAAIGEYCVVCPENSYCHANSSIPEAFPGGWVVEGGDGSHSTIEECFYHDACIGGNKCAQGYQGFKCYDCAAGYSRFGKWSCSQCPSGFSKTFPMIGWIGVCVLLYIASVCRFSTRFVWLTLLIDAFQLIGLLSVFRDHFSPILTPLIDFCSMFVLEMDMFHLDCYFPSISESTIWILALLTMLCCFVLGTIIRFILSHSEKKEYWNRESGTLLTHFTSLLYVLLFPILYHSLQSLTCNNKYYMQSRGVSFSGLAMCWSDADYSWVLIVSSVVLLLSVGMILYSYSQTRKDMAFMESTCSSKGAQNMILPGKSHRMELLGRIFENQSPICFFTAMIPKSIVVFFLVVFREEIHLQTIFILLFIPMLCVTLLFHTPFRMTQKQLKKPIAETAIDSSISGVGEHFAHSATIQKHWYFNPNYLLIEELLLFLCFYADSIIATSRLSAWRIVVEVIIIICSALYVISTILSGIGELAFKNANSFFDVIKEKKPQPVTEQVILAKLQDKNVSANSGSQRSENDSEGDEEGNETEEEEERGEEVGNVEVIHQNELDAERQQRIVEAIDAFGKRLSTDSHN